MNPVLNYITVKSNQAEPQRWLMVLHGIYGSGRNWASITRRLVEARPEWGCLLIDLRMHGRSQGFSGPHSLAAAAQDLEELASQLGIRAGAIMGHSFGGKVALEVARNKPAGLQQVWVIDSTPQVRPPGGSSWELLEVVRRLPAQFSSRLEAETMLMEAGYYKGFAQWMATNLEPAGGKFHWKLDFRALEDLLLDFFRSDYWPVVEQPPPGIELHFVKAAGSDVMDEEAAARVEKAARQTGHVFLHLIEGGHWVNVDNPEAVLKLLVSYLW